jgi:DNA gyrase subunit A
MPVAGISEQGRATQGVKLIRLDESDEIAAITKLDKLEEESNGQATGEATAAAVDTGIVGDAGTTDGAIGDTGTAGDDAGTPGDEPAAETGEAAPEE